MKKLIIVGAGGFGRELLQWVKDINKITPTWEILGFISGRMDDLDGVEIDFKIIGVIEEWKPMGDEEYALAIGTPAKKRKLATMLKDRGAKFATIIHPTAILSEYAHYGEGLIMFPYSKLSCNSTVGDFVTILSSPIGHDNEIGDYTVISGGCNIVRNVKIGKDVFIAAGVAIAQDVEIGDGAYLGLGSVVLKDVKPNTTVFGNPARVVPSVR